MYVYIYIYIYIYSFIYLFTYLLIAVLQVGALGDLRLPLLLLLALLPQHPEPLDGLSMSISNSISSITIISISMLFM